MQCEIRKANMKFRIEAITFYECCLSTKVKYKKYKTYLNPVGNRWIIIYSSSNGCFAPHSSSIKRRTCCRAATRSSSATGSCTAWTQHCSSGRSLWCWCWRWDWLNLLSRIHCSWWHNVWWREKWMNRGSKARVGMESLHADLNCHDQGCFHNQVQFRPTVKTPWKQINNCPFQKWQRAETNSKIDIWQ